MQAQLATTGYRYPVLKAWYVGIPASGPKQYLIQRNETPDEALARLEKRSATWSQHSAITLHPDTIEKCMAYDLAIGLCAAFDSEDLWWSLMHQADWRNPRNPDKDATAYYMKGLLPPDTKLHMNKPKLPKDVVNRPVQNPSPTSMPLPFGIDAKAVMAATQPAMVGLWPRPKPDVEG